MTDQHRSTDLDTDGAPRCPRVGFLFNHDQIHQIAHSLPIALALAEAEPGFEVTLCATNARLAREVERQLAAARATDKVRFCQIGLSPVSRLFEATVGKLAPARKILIYRDNLEFFRNLDVLVVSEKTSLLLKTKYGLNDLILVHTRHGAGDRAIGFDSASARFDHVLCSGPKIRERLIRDAGVAPEKISIVGYPKFDLVADSGWLPEKFDRSKLTVLYNPNPSPHLSSWYRDGRAVLEFFLANPDYQLIFAPHVMLFERALTFSIDKLRVARPGKIDQRFYDAPNIHIDPGSVRSTDMSYVNAAGLYLGDVSSQIYEFLKTPRPCLFLNTHGVAWQGNPDFLFWEFGPVIEDPADLGQGLQAAVRDFDSLYAPRQRAVLADTFDITDEPASRRAARVIAQLARDKV